MSRQIRRWRANRLASGALAAIVLMAGGCQKAEKPAPVVPKVADPHETFGRILEQLKLRFRSFEEVFGNNSVRRVKFSYTVHDVTGQVNTPEDPASERLTAQVSVHTSTRYTPLDLLANEEITAPTAEDSRADNNPATATDANNDSNINLLRRNRAFQTSEEQMKDRIRIAVNASLSQRGEERTDVYEFAFDDGRWVLTSQDTSELSRSIIEKVLMQQ